MSSAFSEGSRQATLPPAMSAHPKSHDPTNLGPTNLGLTNLGLTNGNGLDEALPLLVGGGEKLTAVYDRILDAAIDLSSAHTASIQVFHGHRNALELVASRGFHPVSAEHWKWVGFDSSTSCGRALNTGHRIIVPDTETCDFIVGTSQLEEFRRSEIRAMQSTPLIADSGELLGMMSTHWRTPHHPADVSLRRFDGFARQVAHIVEFIKSNAGGQDDERLWRLASIVEYSNDAIISKDLDGIITSWNNSAERIFGYAAEEAVGRPITIVIPPDLHHEEIAILERVKRGERIENYETVRRRKQGNSIAVSLTISPIKTAEGKIIGASKIARDISEQKRAEERIATLAREAQHRTKNILATVQATVNLSHADTPEDLKEAIQGRIRALAKAHDLFVESRWVGAELSALVEQELAPYLHDPGRAKLEGPPTVLAPTIAQTVAILLHELTTNAAKYGALSTPQGRVEIAWSRQPDGCLSLRWSETGGPPVTPPTRQGFGIDVMNRIIRSALKGTVHHEWRPEGLACEITFPT
jgi:PAS domain S-box-containing protein